MIISLNSRQNHRPKEQFSDEQNQNMFEVKYSVDNNIINLMFDSENYIITRISWTKKEDYRFNYLLGIFEGDNDPSFSNAVPIAMIKEVDYVNQENYIDVNIPNVYKYIRYIPPNKNKTDISPIKFYGQIKTELNSNLKEFQPTNLPLISIHTEGSTKPIKKDVELDCKVIIINEGKIDTNADAKIKVRGKSTSMQEKKPYRLKFENEEEILGQEGSYKKWTLIANHYDKTLMRNALAFKISELIGFEYTPRCLPVDLILNGEYRGNYYICDQIEIGKNRINLDKMKETDVTEPNITGGYYLEIDGGGDFYGYSYLETPKGIKWKINNPDDDEIASEQKNYIIQRMNNFESEAYDGNFNSMDLDTYSKFFIQEEFCGDPDELWSSFYFTKKRNDDKFYFGPVWDFDLAFDNDMRLIPTNDKPNFAFYYGASSGTMLDFTKALIGNKIIINYIKNTWENLKDSNLNENVLLNFIEEQKEYISESAELNFLKWNTYIRGTNFGKGFLLERFNIDVDILKEYVTKRFPKLTELINNAVSTTK